MPRGPLRVNSYCQEAIWDHFPAPGHQGAGAFKFMLPGSRLGPFCGSRRPGGRCVEIHVARKPFGTIFRLPASMGPLRLNSCCQEAIWDHFVAPGAQGAAAFKFTLPGNPLGPFSGSRPPGGRCVSIHAGGGFRGLSPQCCRTPPIPKPRSPALLEPKSIAFGWEFRGQRSAKP